MSKLCPKLFRRYQFKNESIESSRYVLAMDDGRYWSISIDDSSRRPSPETYHYWETGYGKQKTGFFRKLEQIGYTLYKGPINVNNEARRHAHVS